MAVCRAAPYRSLNLGDHVGDAPGAVRRPPPRFVISFLPPVQARSLLSVRARSRLPHSDRWVWLRQVHGDRVVTVTATPNGVPEADAAVTDRVDLPLVVLTADCAPIALVGEGAIGVVHAGWPGLEAGVIGRAVAAIRELADGPIRAILGPCVHPARYEFGADLLARLVDRLGPGVAARTASGARARHPCRGARLAAARAGVDDLDDVGVCTAASPDHFSYRRDGVTGRQAVVVVRRP